jgi:hypothetical protein
VDDVLRHVLDQLSEDTRVLLDRDAVTFSALRQAELAEYEVDAPLCSGHTHDHDD